MHDNGPARSRLAARPALADAAAGAGDVARGGFRAGGAARGRTAITTDTDGLTAGEVKIPVADGEIPAYRAMPATGGHFPVVLVVQEIFGVHEHIKDLCRRFAKEGYLAVAPELYARQGDVSKIRTGSRSSPKS